VAAQIGQAPPVGALDAETPRDVRRGVGQRVDKVAGIATLVGGRHRMQLIGETKAAVLARNRVSSSLPAFTTRQLIAIIAKENRALRGKVRLSRDAEPTVAQRQTAARAPYSAALKNEKLGVGRVVVCTLIRRMSNVVCSDKLSFGPLEYW